MAKSHHQLSHHTASPLFYLRKYFRRHRQLLSGALFLLFVIGGLAAVYFLNQNSQDLRQRASQTIETAAIITLDPSSHQLAPGESATISINLDPNSLEVSAANLKLTYPADIFTSVSIQSADELYEVLADGQTTQTEATISLSAGINDEGFTNYIDTPITLAYLKLTAGSTGGQFNINLDPATFVSAQNITGNALTEFPKSSITIAVDETAANADNTVTDDTTTDDVVTEDQTADQFTDPVDTNEEVVADDDTNTDTDTVDNSTDTADSADTASDNTSANNTQDTTANVCVKPAPPLSLDAATGQNSGEITLTWQKPGNQTHFSLVYGTASGKNEFSLSNLGDTTSHTIRHLIPGTRYFVKMAAVNDCGSSVFSSEVSAVAQKSSAIGGATGNPTQTPPPKKSTTASTVTSLFNTVKNVIAPPKPSPTPTPRPIAQNYPDQSAPEEPVIPQRAPYQPVEPPKLDESSDFISTTITIGLIVIGIALFGAAIWWFFKPAPYIPQHKSTPLATKSSATTTEPPVPPKLPAPGHLPHPPVHPQPTPSADVPAPVHHQAPTHKATAHHQPPPHHPAKPKKSTPPTPHDDPHPPAGY